MLTIGCSDEWALDVPLDNLDRFDLILLLL